MSCRIALTVAAMGFWTFSVVAEEPSFDCTKANSSAEELICNDAKLAALDRRMAERFGEAVRLIRQLDASAENAENSLRATQRGWIKGRNDCWKSTDLPDCVEASYLMREGELVAMWMLEEPDTVASFVCDGNPANEVTVYFFDTELPSIRLEYGDGIRAAWRVPAASGTKYIMEFGGLFWLKGEDVMFSWNEGNTMSCVNAS